MGAGPAGLALARTFKCLGIPFDVYERHRGIGGIWDQANPGSPVYDSAHFISSKGQSHFLDFEMPAHYPDYPSHRQILAYLRSFARAYDLQANIQFNMRVERADPLARGWRVHLAGGEAREYAWLVAASGANWHPRLPDFPGRFTGEARHASTYRSPDELRGKRVLVVGGGNSGCDIACDAASSADAAFLSLRRGYHFLPKHVFGQPFDEFAERGRRLPTWLSQVLLERLLRLLNGDLTRFGLRAPDHKVLESHPIVNSQVLHHLSHGNLTAKPNVGCFDGGEAVFADGTRAQIDLVIYATGYRYRIPYLQDGLLASEQGRPDLYMKIFSRDHPRLFVLGLFETNAAGYKLFDNMADLIGRAILAQSKGRQDARRLARLIRTDGSDDARGGIDYVKSARHVGYVDFGAYGRQVARLRRHMAWPAIATGHFDRARADPAPGPYTLDQRPRVLAR